MKRNMMIVLAAVFAAIFLFSGMMLWQDYRDQEASAEVFDNVADLIVEETQPTTESYAEDAGTQPAEPTEPAAELTAYEKYAAVYAQNNDFVGWLCIEGTNINYPVMQTPEEPNYYLKRAFNRSYSDYGVPYVQENCALGISDNIVIYGHNMSNGSMFADLCRYEKKSFWEAHPIIHFDTLSGYGEYEIVTVFKTVAYLYITVSHKTADEMADRFGFSKEQREQLAALLEDENNMLWASVLYGIGASDDAIVTVAVSQIGNVGGHPYWSWYGFESRVEWCACFVSWCANECGYIDAGIIPKFAGCVNGVNWFQERGQWADNSAEPTPGMIIFFDWDKEETGGPDSRSDHVGIVVKVENGRVYTIEGNSSDSCRERSYPLGYYEILGYGIPAY